MNRAARAARMFLLLTVVPALGAAGYAAYEYHVQPLVKAPPPKYSKGMRTIVGAPKANARPESAGFLLGTFAGRGSTLTSFDKALGQRANLSLYYLMWGRRFPSLSVALTAREGAETVIELQPGKVTNVITMAQIAAGDGDKWLGTIARRVARLRDQVIVSFAPEMNGTTYVYGSQNVNGASYIAAYRHVYNYLSQSVAGRYITFMWQPSAIHRTTPNPMPDWPGARYVNLVALDGYYYYRSDTFRSIFGQTIADIRSVSPSTPIMIGETAAAPDFHRQVWDIRNLFAGVRRTHLVGLIWFDSNQLRQKERAAVRRFHQDWRLEDSPRALSAFRAELRAFKLAVLVRQSTG